MNIIQKALNTPVSQRDAVSGELYLRQPDPNMRSHPDRDLFRSTELVRIHREKETGRLIFSLTGSMAGAFSDEARFELHGGDNLFGPVKAKGDAVKEVSRLRITRALAVENDKAIGARIELERAVSVLRRAQEDYPLRPPN